MIFKNGLYDKLKWFSLVGFPALITFFGVLGTTLEWDFTQMVITIAVAFNTMIGTMLGISNIKYNKTILIDEYDQEEENSMEIETNEEGGE